MTNWTTPYNDPLRIVPYGMAVIGTVFAAAGIGIVATQTHSVVAVPIVLPLLGIWLTFMWRFARIGLVISDVGVRIRWLLRTRTFGWNQVQRFHTARDILAPARLWIELTDGSQIRTPIQRVRYLLPGATLADGSAWLTPDRYKALLRTLYSRLAQAQSAARPTTSSKTAATAKTKASDNSSKPSALSLRPAAPP
ncbi:hypothetical protein [Phytohabitans kaempferiae]|uniref:DUF304 domain-containing protein n=1 Tax=Phytohabitans kaempferiae TaxID=1620943 RepID=A0ABV6LXY3_9ACTN